MLKPQNLKVLRNVDGVFVCVQQWLSFKSMSKLGNQDLCPRVGNILPMVTFYQTAIGQR